MNIRSIALTVAASTVLFAGAANARVERFQVTALGSGSTEAAAANRAKQAAVQQCTSAGGRTAGAPTATFFRAFGTNQAGPDVVIVGYEYLGSVSCTKQVADDGGPQFGEV